MVADGPASSATGMMSCSARTSEVRNVGWHSLEGSEEAVPAFGSAEKLRYLGGRCGLEWDTLESVVDEDFGIGLETIAAEHVDQLDTGEC